MSRHHTQSKTSKNLNNNQKKHQNFSQRLGIGKIWTNSFPETNSLSIMTEKTCFLEMSQHHTRDARTS